MFEVTLVVGDNAHVIKFNNENDAIAFDRIMFDNGFNVRTCNVLGCFGPNLRKPKFCCDFYCEDHAAEFDAFHGVTTELDKFNAEMADRIATHAATCEKYEHSFLDGTCVWCYAHAGESVSCN